MKAPLTKTALSGITLSMACGLALAGGNPKEERAGCGSSFQQDAEAADEELLFGYLDFSSARKPSPV